MSIITVEGIVEHGQIRLKDNVRLPDNTRVFVEVVGRFGGRIESVAAQGDFVYLGIGFRLGVLDVSDPARVAVVGQSADFPAPAGSLAVVGNRIYVAAGTAGLRIVDVADPTHPVEMGFFDTPGDAVGVAVAGSYAYVADSLSGLRVVDVANPANPVEVGGYLFVKEDLNLGEARGVAAAGGYAYVAVSNGLHVVDVSRPATPTLAGFYSVKDGVRSVAVGGNHAYLRAGTSFGDCLSVVDVSVPTNPRQIGGCSSVGKGSGLVVDGSYAYVVDDDEGLRVVGMADPTSPTVAGVYDTPGYASAVAIAGTRVYVVDRSDINYQFHGSASGLHVVDVSTPSRPTGIGFYPMPGAPVGVAAVGRHAYVADNAAGLRIVDFETRERPTEVGAYVTPGPAAGVTVVGRYAYVSIGGLRHSDVRIVDVSNPADPVDVGVYHSPTYVSDVVVTGTHAYVAAWDGLYIVNVADPTKPAQIGSYRPPGFSAGVAVVGNHAYFAVRTGDAASSEVGLHVLDVADPAHPVKAGFYATPEVLDVAAAGRYAYVATRTEGLDIVDVFNPISPTHVGVYTTTPMIIWQVTVADRYAYLAVVTRKGGELVGGVRVVDVADPTQPREVAALDVPGSITVGGKCLFVAGGSSGLRVLRFTGQRSSPLPTPAAVAPYRLYLPTVHVGGCGA